MEQAAGGVDLLFHMADVACVRADMNHGWKAIHEHLLKLCQTEEHSGWNRRKTGMTREDKILKHLRKAGTISVREAMDDYQLSGGSLTKAVSILRKEGYLINTVWGKHPITKQRYARYKLMDRFAFGKRDAA
jgi:hypothetical protein